MEHLLRNPGSSIAALRHRVAVALALLLLPLGQAHAQETLPIPDRLQQSIQSIMCVPPAEIDRSKIASTKRLVVAGAGVPVINTMALPETLGERCLYGHYVVFTVEVAIFPNAARGDYQTVGSDFIQAMCATKAGGGYHPGCSIDVPIKGAPAPNSHIRNFGMEGVRANQLPRGGGRIFAGLGEDVKLENITTFASYDPGPRFARGNFYVWEICHHKMDNTKTCWLVDSTDSTPFGSTMPQCGLKPPEANDKGYCLIVKRERLATEKEMERHIKGVLLAECRGRGDDHLNLCHVVHTDRFIVMARSLLTPFIVQPYGAGSTWGYADNIDRGNKKVTGDRIYPMSAHLVASVSSHVFEPGAVVVEDQSSPGLPSVNTYESQVKPVPPPRAAGPSTPAGPGGSAPPPQPGGGGASPAPSAGSGSCPSGVWIPMIGCRG